MIAFIEKLSLKERIGLSVAAAFILLVLIDRLIITPMYTTFSRLDREIKKAETQLGEYMRNAETR